MFISITQKQGTLIVYGVVSTTIDMEVETLKDVILFVISIDWQKSNQIRE